MEVLVILSPEPPQKTVQLTGYNWTDDAGSVCIRQFFYDWENEQKADLTIERVGAKYPPPPERPELIVDKAELLIKWLDEAER